MTEKMVKKTCIEEERDRMRMAADGHRNSNSEKCLSVT